MTKLELLKSVITDYDFKNDDLIPNSYKLRESQIIEEEEYYVCIYFDSLYVISKDYKIMCSYNIDSDVWEIHKLKDGYLIMSEFEVVKISNDFKTVLFEIYSKAGEVLCSPFNENHTFKLYDDYFEFYDWEDNYYKYDLDGNLLEEDIKRKSR